MQPLISVIIPAYNIEEYIDRCLESVCNQTYSNLEIIVIDDGSTDKTPLILDNWQKKDARIRVIHKENEGVSKARNKGIESANGDYIGFVDGDDMISPDMLEFLYDNLVKANAQISHCGYQMVFPDRRDNYHGPGEKIEQDNHRGLKDLLEGSIVEPGLWNKLYKKELFEGLRLNENIKYNEDLLLNYYLFKKASKSIFVDEMKYFYMVRSNSATGSINNNKIIDPILVLQEIMKNEQGETLNILIRRYINVLTNFIVMNKKALSKETVEFQKEMKQDLSRIFKDNLGIVSKGQQYKTRLALMSPWLYRVIHYIQGNVTGNRNKYKVK